MDPDVRYYTSPWRSDFLVWAFDYLVDLGYADAAVTRDFLAGYTVARFTNYPDFNRFDGAPYHIAVESVSGTEYTSWNEIWQMSFAGRSGAAPTEFNEVNCALCYPAIARVALTGAMHAALPDAESATDAAPSEGAAPQSSPTARPASLSLPPLENEQHLDEWMSGPCLAYSPQRKLLACVSAELEMGFVTATFVLLSSETGAVTEKHVVYEGRSSIEPKSFKQDAMGAAKGALASGDFTERPVPIAPERVGRLDAGVFRVAVAGRTLSAPAPKLTQADAPQAFKGDPNGCMTWSPAGGQSFWDVAVLRIASQHSFTKEAGKPCHFAGELNDETFPSGERWVVLRPE